MKTSEPITISLLVSTYNWPEALLKVLKSISEQVVKPLEVVIADDGSTADTKQLIDDFKQHTDIPIVHVWQEDKGFRRTSILNKAIAQCHGDYIVQIDGDVIVGRYFIADHKELAERGCFVCGSRVKLPSEISKTILTTDLLIPSKRKMPMSFVINSFRSKWLRKYLATRYAKKIDHLRGCNMAFWKEDIIKINGYNEDLQQWGHEDGELAYRLHFAGVRKKALKFGGVVYHLYHNEASRDNEQRHLDELEKVKSGHIKRCDNGIDKYLNPAG